MTANLSIATVTIWYWIVGIKALHGNPYDGHILANAIKQIERITNRQVKEAFVDKGYRGHDYTGDAAVYITGQRGKGEAMSIIS